MKFANSLLSRSAAAVTLAALCALALAAACASTASPSHPSQNEAPPGTAAGPAIEHEAQAVPGVSDDHVLFGQSAAFTGPAAQLGNDMRLGILAAFNEANQNGGVHGRQLRLESLNDSYETDFALSNTHTLIDKSRGFCAHWRRGYTDFPGCVSGSPGRRRAVYRPVHWRRVPARSEFDQCAQSPGLLLSGNRRNGRSPHRRSGHQAYSRTVSG